jgi:NIMA-interacting peptidyl-prolyl cis-trans isomerase 4
MPPKGAAPKGGAKGGKGKGGGDDDDESPSGTCNQVKVRHILCEKHGKCMEAMKELMGYETTDEKGNVTKVEPAKFNVVAQKYSEDKAKEARGAEMRTRPGSACVALTRARSQGGNLGWKRRDELNGVFAEAAFKLGKGKARAAGAAPNESRFVALKTQGLRSRR